MNAYSTHKKAKFCIDFLHAIIVQTRPDIPTRSMCKKMQNDVSVSNREKRSAIKKMTEIIEHHGFKGRNLQTRQIERIVHRDHQETEPDTCETSSGSIFSA